MSYICNLDSSDKFFDMLSISFVMYLDFDKSNQISQTQKGPVLKSLDSEAGVNLCKIQRSDMHKYMMLKQKPM